MAKYKAYPEYKDSGVEWLGKIPNHWTTLAIKHVAQLNPSKSCIGIEKMKGMCSFIPMEKLKFNSLSVDDVKDVSDVYNGYTYFENEDILIAKVTPCFENKNMVVAHNLHNGIGFGSSEIYVLRCNDIINNDFLFYRLQEDNFMSIAEGAMTGAGGLKRVPSDILNNFKFGLPRIKEQSIIVNFLKHETAKIDILIEKQQQLIELLKEKRQAVISHAVTKGLNPDVPMKDSGVEWLGEIPEHWLCTKIKYIALLTPKKSSVNFKNNDECTFIPMEKLKRNSLVTDESKLIRDVINGYTYFEDDDLLLAKVTPCFENKNIAVARGLVNNIGFGSTEIYVLRPTEKIRVNYLLYRLQEDNFIRTATGAMTGAGGLKRVPSDFLLNYPIAIPPKPEMDAIVAYINAQEVHYDLMEKNATQAVQLLQERRTALISAAVTGKIDVRDWVAPDTQDVEESQEATA
ncbi:restriction endonuclease subunit S [Klebsiella quasipneumoniae subsp. similipneumoniae]|uniref:restriction endonuclease subunit S n=2 Tax=Klebsiella quasipneumoniae TaxID=1463165 RepID=UPI000E2C6880|nr:restriction endonuclease subunit S [Klebsiella quasipneumoniae]MCJ1841758.1 restriction endonuclease subunit S [Klebsiella quasipneumoniae subsp. similipneumoniae]MDQ5385497.1 restriction endonuclease subunit S [Klebsiella quasipneumoniae subsp. similipneumoniae]MDQ5438828.1 restriction endonuclease subunit S [Klebsiella quasipneumoniae subsp. similipneumoniae]NKF15618.1 restriction endonuclease subunit S [Klebsiella quasipneumoniae]QPV81523.1 restriction endonuclease subunit S [Klebsiella 